MPDWDDLAGLRLLCSVDYYQDAAFNHHLLADLLAEIDAWKEYELTRSGPEGREAMIGRVREAVAEALRGRRYVIFLSL